MCMILHPLVEFHIFLPEVLFRITVNAYVLRLKILLSFRVRPKLWWAARTHYSMRRKGTDGIDSYKILKKEALVPWPTLRLRFCIDNLRTWTLCCKGQQPPSCLLESILLCTQLATRKRRFLGERLSWKLHLRVLRFALAGGPKLWAAAV